MNCAIKIENLSKQYRLGLVGTRTLSHDLKRKWALMRGKEDPYLKIGEINDRSAKGASEYVWALKDINYEVQSGEILGIIGKNGAGKSTLLKILSKVTGPTTGNIIYKGKIGSLLEVGTGFHQELTGRENIYLNGAILGMTRSEINKKLEEIVDFSGVEKYIDTPVKRYSSGMVVRLGFAVAAHLDPEILVVDEVLAVGDAEFQKKAIGKMKDISKKDGRTVLFVSHNMTSVQNLCENVCVFENGRIDFIGNTADGIRNYLDKNSQTNNLPIKNQLESIKDDEHFELLDLYIKQSKNYNNLITIDPIEISFKFKIKKEILGLRIGFDISEANTGIILFRSFHDDNKGNIESMNRGIHILNATIPANLLKEGNYLVSASIGIHNIRWIIFDQVKFAFDLYNLNGINKGYADKRVGVIMPKILWGVCED